MMFCQLGRSLSDKEIIERLVMSYADRLEQPVHFVPPIRILQADHQWPRRGVIG